jgi:hypothetical protein
MRAEGCPESELAIIHLFKGLFDAIVYDEEDWKPIARRDRRR